MYNHSNSVMDSLLLLRFDQKHQQLIKQPIIIDRQLWWPKTIIHKRTPTLKLFIKYIQRFKGFAKRTLRF